MPRLVSLRTAKQTKRTNATDAPPARRARLPPLTLGEFGEADADDAPGDMLAPPMGAMYTEAEDELTMASAITAKSEPCVAPNDRVADCSVVEVSSYCA